MTTKRVLKPWKHPSLDLTLPWPLLGSEKLDGIRCWIVDGQPLTASNKLIPNHYIRETLARPEYHNLDGEIICGSFRETTRAVMSHHGNPTFEFRIFDRILPGTPYFARYHSIPNHVGACGIRLPHTRLDTIVEAQTLLTSILDQQGEGLCLRDPKAHWTSGRCPRSRYALLAIKPLADGEATVVDFEELYHNDNAKFTNERGLTQRSLSANGRSPAGTLGALTVIGTTAFAGQRFNIGTGFTDAERQAIWLDRPGHLGALVKFRYQPVGGYDLPRQPRFVGWRSLLD